VLLGLRLVTGWRCSIEDEAHCDSVDVWGLCTMVLPSCQLFFLHVFRTRIFSVYRHADLRAQVKLDEIIMGLLVNSHYENTQFTVNVYTHTTRKKHTGLSK
jgi:hypothetical protein